VAARQVPPAGARGSLDDAIARLLSIGTNVAVGLLAIGFAAMVLGGISPYAPAPVLDPGQLVGELLAGRATGFLWLGLLVVIATPTSRVLLALVAFVRSREWEMVAVAAAILGVITLSVILARLAEA
jgi:uncharacterized membrane protein